MIETFVKKDIELKKKNGSVVSFKQGERIRVSTAEREDGFKLPWKAVVQSLDNDTKVTVQMLSLHRFSTEFLYFDFDEIQECAFSSVVDSMTGKRVEPDGYDEYGFPSCLQAAGIM